jgi:hypothetical protein
MKTLDNIEKNWKRKQSDGVKQTKLGKRYLILKLKFCAQKDTYLVFMTVDITQETSPNGVAITKLQCGV